MTKNKRSNLRCCGLLRGFTCLALAALALTVAPVRAQTITGSSGTNAFTVSAADLLQSTGLDFVSDGIVVNAGENNISQGTTASLKDGTFGPAGALGGYCIAGGSVAYVLNTTLNPDGYTITNITTYSGWANAGRANQNYTVSFRRVGSGTFEAPIVVTYSATASPPANTQVIISGFAETNVDAILFDFDTPAQQNGGVGYKELDVFGYGATPVSILPTVTGSSSTNAYAVSATDLLATSELSSVSDALTVNVGENNASSQGTLASLTDGTFGPAGALGGYCLSGGTVTYNLNTNLNPAGYTITNIATYTGWGNAGRANQNYTLSFRRVGAGSFVNPIVVTYVASGTPANTKVMIGGLNETNVEAIRFDFSTPAQQNGGVGYKELDVLGYGAVAPEVPIAYFWDNNGATAGFGTAAGTWASPTIGDATQGLSTNATGSTLPVNVTTTASDLVNFGNGATGLGAGTITVSGNVTNSQMTFAAGTGAIGLSGGTINFPAGGTGTITANNTNVDITISSVVAGTGLTKSGSGTVILPGANLHTGVTTVSGGILSVSNAASLGSTSGNTVVASGATLRIAGGISIAEPISITGSGVGGNGAISSAGSNTLTAAITSSGGRLQTVGLDTLTLTGGITGGAGSILVGDFTINSNPINVGANRFIFAGDAVAPPSALGKTIRLNAAGNVWNDTILFFAAIVKMGDHNVWPANAAVQFGWTTVDNAASTFDLNGFNQTVATIETTTLVPVPPGADIRITGGGTLTVDQSAFLKEFTGVISDGATPTALTKTGVGTLALSGVNTYSGNTVVSNGSLQLNTSTALPNTTQVYLFTAAPNSLYLAVAETNQVPALYIDGVAQPAGVYDNTTAPIAGPGFIEVVAGPAAPGNFSGISVSGTTLTLNVTNGTPNGPWTLLSSTNLVLPLIQWTTNSTGTYDGSGHLNTTLLNTATNAAEFFILK